MVLILLFNILLSDTFSKCLYFPPYAKGKSHRVIQGFGGKYSHQAPLEYGVDFEMPKGTPVFSSRKGVVHEVKMDSNSGGPHKKFLKSANKVIIDHEDGTYALYAHLKYNSVRVKKGQTLPSNFYIAQSGCTGWCDGAHLHFEIFEKKKNGRKSIPFKIATQSGCSFPKLNANVRY